MENDVKTNSPRAWLLAARPKTLSAAAVPVMVGSALAAADLGADFQVLPCVLCFLFAFIMQIDANFINDYFDFRKGSDRTDRLGPERACAQGWITPRAMQGGIVVTTLLACVAGLPLLWIGGWELLLVGAVCVLFAFLYTLGLSYRGWGDVLVLVFFGWVPVCFTYSLQTGVWTWASVVCATACGLVIDTLLMVNNFRDRDQDRISGKRTVVVRWGHVPAAPVTCGWASSPAWVACRLWQAVICGQQSCRSSTCSSTSGPGSSWSASIRAVRSTGCWA